MGGDILGGRSFYSWVDLVWAYLESWLVEMRRLHVVHSATFFCRLHGLISHLASGISNTTLFIFLKCLYYVSSLLVKDRELSSSAAPTCAAAGHGTTKKGLRCRLFRCFYMHAEQSPKFRNAWVLRFFNCTLIRCYVLIRSGAVAECFDDKSAFENEVNLRAQAR